MSPSRAQQLRKLQSLAGVVPLGLFLLLHLGTNASALRGRAAFDRAVDMLQHTPALPVVEVLLIYLPLAFHAGWGIKLAIAGRPALQPRTTAGRLYLMQRVTGAFTLVFVAFHLYEFRIHQWLFGMSPQSFHTVLEMHLSSTRWGFPWIACGYLLGLASTVFHFANGLFDFGTTWGFAPDGLTRKRLGYASAALGAVLFLMGTSTVLYFATGSRFLLPAPSETADPACNPTSR